MKTFVTAAGFAVGASAAIIPRTDGCCFQLTASGGVSGTLGQLDDGQNRVGGGLGSATYCINGDTITDGSGRGCILTAPTTQFQCDMGATPDGGFSVDSNGMLQHDGDSTFYACPADSGEYNIYTEAVDNQPKCVEVSLSTGGKCSASAGSTCPPAQTVTKTEQGKPVYKTETQYKTEYKTAYKTETQYNTAYKTETKAVPTTIYKTETVQNTKVQPTTIYQTKTVEETETATVPTTIYQTKTIQTTETAQKPTTVYKTKTIEETETATKPTTVYQTSTIQQTETAPPTTVYKTKTEEETETATKPTTIYETKTIQQTVTAQQPTTVYNTKTIEETETQKAQPTTVYKTKTEQAAPNTITKAVTQVVTKTEECSQKWGGGKPTHGWGGKPEHGWGGKPTHGGGKPTPTNEGSACPTDLSGSYQYPHLIVPVSSEHPDQGYGTSYNGMMNGSMSSVFNFDIPKEYEGQSCSLVFMLPKKGDLDTSDYTFNGHGSVSVDHLSSPCGKDTTWNSVPSVAGHMGSFSPQAGNSYVVSTDSCAAGTTQSYELSAADGLDLEYFQDYNPSPIGLYITTC